MSALPDELWRRILEIGVDSPNWLNYKDLCCLSISCRRLNRLSNEESLWCSLLSADFPKIENTQFASSSSSTNNPSPHSSPKTLYKTRFERDKARKLAAHRRAVLRVESQIAEHWRKMQEIELRLAEETDKVKATITEITNLRNVREMREKGLMQQRSSWHLLSITRYVITTCLMLGLTNVGIGRS